MKNLEKEIQKKLQERNIPIESISLLVEKDHLLSSASTLLAGLIERYVQNKLPKHFVDIEISVNDKKLTIRLMKMNSSKTILDYRASLASEYFLADKNILKNLFDQKRDYLINNQLTPVFFINELVKGKYDDDFFPKISRGKNGLIKSIADPRSKGIGYVALVL